MNWMLIGNCKFCIVYRGLCVIDHFRLYYMAAHTETGPLYATVMDEKRKALLAHIVGIHEHPDNTHYQKCGHGSVKTLRMDPGLLSNILVAMIR